MSIESVSALIVGAGPTGLAVAAAVGRGAVVVEKESRVGGLCRSIERAGAVFDIGGHSFHTPHPEVRALIESSLPAGLFWQQRNAQVRFGDRLIPYPFQKHFEQVADPAVVEECRAGLAAQRPDPARAQHFEEYIERKFGRGIARHFMLPYNRKLWARDLRTVSCEWTSERVAEPKGRAERFEESGGRRKPLQSDTQVGYPAAGGFEGIYAALARRAPDVRTRCEIVRICPRTRRAWTREGAAFQWKCLVSTAPLPELLSIVDGAPSELIETARSLEFMSLRVELIVAKGPPRSPVQRIYVHDPDIPPHKIAFNHNSSDSLRSRPVQAIMAETSISEHKGIDEARILPKTVEMLCELDLLGSPADVLEADHLDVYYAYPVYTKDRPGKVALVREWLERRGIFSEGRFGAWEYVNSDRCVAKGLELGAALARKTRVA